MSVKKAAVINDLSGFGKCSLVADISVLSALGTAPCPVPTAVLSAQTGFPHHSMRDCADDMENCIESYTKMNESFDGILTGFFTGEREAELSASFIEKFGRNDSIILVDPVMGDRGRAFANFSDGLCDSLRELVKKADIVTPNVTELLLLAGEKFTPELVSSLSRERIIEIAWSVIEKQGQSIVVTGVSGDDSDNHDMISNILVTEKEAKSFSSKRFGGGFSGTGDLFAAVMLGGALRGISTEDTIKLAGEFIGKAASSATERNVMSAYGVDYEPYLSILVNAVMDGENNERC